MKRIKFISVKILNWKEIKYPEYARIPIKPTIDLEYVKRQFNDICINECIEIDYIIGVVYEGEDVAKYLPIEL